MDSIEKSDEFGNWLLLSPFHSLLPNQVCLVGNWPSTFIFSLGPQIVAIAILRLWCSDVGNPTLGFWNIVLLKMLGFGDVRVVFFCADPFWDRYYQYFSQNIYLLLTSQLYWIAFACIFLRTCPTLSVRGI